jgi:hypothetical protein
MDLRLTAILVGLLLVVVVAAYVWWRIGSRRAAVPDRLDTLADWPPTATRILTTNERLAQEVLVRALPEYMVLAQVPLARFLKVPTRNSYTEWLRRLGNQCADLVVCDKTSQVVAIVDVQAPAERAGERARKRLNRMARVLKAAGIPLHVWTEGALPGVEAARATVLPRAPEGPSLAAAAPATGGVAPAVPRVPTAPSPSPFEDPDRDPTPDEIIEAREPPPSTWFDEFNSGPTPLGKPTKR